MFEQLLMVAKERKPAVNGDVPMSDDGFWDVTDTGLTEFKQSGPPTKVTVDGKECLKYGNDFWQGLVGFDMTKGYGYTGMVKLPSDGNVSKRRYFAGSAYAMRQYNLLMDNPNGTVNFTSSDQGVNKPLGSYPKDEWFHIAVTVKEKLFSVYINGKFLGSYNSSIGNDRFYPVCTYEGDVYAYNQRIYKYAPTADEISQIYAEDSK